MADPVRRQPDGSARQDEDQTKAHRDAASIRPKPKKLSRPGSPRSVAKRAVVPDEVVRRHEAAAPYQLRRGDEREHDGAERRVVGCALRGRPDVTVVGIDRKRVPGERSADRTRRSARSGRSSGRRPAASRAGRAVRRDRIGADDPGIERRRPGEIEQPASGRRVLAASAPGKDERCERHHDQQRPAPATDSVRTMGAIHGADQSAAKSSEGSMWTSGEYNRALIIDALTRFRSTGGRRNRAACARPGSGRDAGWRGRAGRASGTIDHRSAGADGRRRLCLVGRLPVVSSVRVRELAPLVSPYDDAAGNA